MTWTVMIAISWIIVIFSMECIEIAIAKLGIELIFELVLLFKTENRSRSRSRNGATNCMCK